MCDYMKPLQPYRKARKLQEKYVVTKLRNTLKPGTTQITVTTAGFELRISLRQEPERKTYLSAQRFEQDKKTIR